MEENYAMEVLEIYVNNKILWMDELHASTNDKNKVYDKMLAKYREYKPTATKILVNRKISNFRKKVNADIEKMTKNKNFTSSLYYFDKLKDICLHRRAYKEKTKTVKQQRLATKPPSLSEVVTTPPPVDNSKAIVTSIVTLPKAGISKHLQKKEIENVYDFHSDTDDDVPPLKRKKSISVSESFDAYDDAPKMPKESPLHLDDLPMKTEDAKKEVFDVESAVVERPLNFPMQHVYVMSGEDSVNDEFDNVAMDTASELAKMSDYKRLVAKNKIKRLVLEILNRQYEKI